MRSTSLLGRNLAYYWRTNLAVVFGVAAAVAVLAGALVVGESVRASLRELFLQRLGKTDHAVASVSFFREQLAADIESGAGLSAGGGGLGAVAPLALEATAMSRGQRARGAECSLRLDTLMEKLPGRVDAVACRRGWTRRC